MYEVPYRHPDHKPEEIPKRTLLEGPGSWWGLSCGGSQGTIKTYGWVGVRGYLVERGFLNLTAIPGGPGSNINGAISTRRVARVETKLGYKPLTTRARHPSSLVS